MRFRHKGKPFGRAAGTYTLDLKITERNPDILDVRGSLIGSEGNYPVTGHITLRVAHPGMVDRAEAWVTVEGDDTSWDREPALWGFNERNPDQNLLKRHVTSVLTGRKAIQHILKGLGRSEAVNQRLASTSLYGKLYRLAREQPQLRAHLVPLLRQYK